MAKSARGKKPVQKTDFLESTLDEGGIKPLTRTLVFISHDSRDSDLAEAFANLLSDVSAGTLKSFRSSDKKGTSGIEFGTEWYTAIMSQLGDATDVVALLTQRSVDRPWILYEAGVAKGKLDTNVLGIAIGVPLDQVSSGPFGQFQNCDDDEDSLTRLVLQLIARNPDAAPRDEAVRMQVRVFQQKAQEIVKLKDKKLIATPSSSDESNIAKLFEETKVMVRELPLRVEERVRNISRRPISKMGRRFHPRMIEELLRHPVADNSRDSAATVLLMAVTLMREDVPWIYELGVELYRRITFGNDEEIDICHNQLRQGLELLRHSLWMREILDRGDEEILFLIRYFPELLDQIMSRISRFKSRKLTTRRKLSKPLFSKPIPVDDNSQK
jgi:TIR domain